VVAEVSLELTGDGRDGERRECYAVAGLEPADRQQQCPSGDLDEVVPVGAPAGVASGQGVAQGEVDVDEFVDDLLPAFGGGRQIEVGEEFSRALFALDNSGCSSRPTCHGCLLRSSCPSRHVVEPP